MFKKFNLVKNENLLTIHNDREKTNGLAMANINKKEHIKEAYVIRIFAQNAPRRIQLKDWRHNKLNKKICFL